MLMFIARMAYAPLSASENSDDNQQIASEADHGGDNDAARGEDVGIECLFSAARS